MNWKFKYYLSVTFLIILLMTSCKKYEDDSHFVTLRKPTTRIIGSYEIKEIVLNNIDYTDSIYQLWGIKTIFDFTDIYYYYFDFSYPSNPIEQLDEKSLIVRLDNEISTEHPYLPKIYRGEYLIADNNRGVGIRLFNPIDLIVANIENYISTDIYRRSINYYFEIKKLDKSGLSLVRNNGDRIVFERIE